jgi:hypothetical protein
VADNNIPYTVTQTAIPVYYFSTSNEGKNYQLHQAYKQSKQWSDKKQQEFLDSLFRGAYIPAAIVLRELDILSEDMTPLTRVPPIFELLDGVQRIKTIRDFFWGKIETPMSLKNCKIFRNHGTPKWSHDLPITSGFLFDYPPPLEYYIGHRITMNTAIITGISDKNNKDHEATALKIFRRIHQDK